MRSQTIDVSRATGRILCSTVFRTGGKKLLAKGHLIREDDVRRLEDEGLTQVYVAELEENEVSESEAAMRIATEMACGTLEICLTTAGRANLFASEPSCLLVDDELLKQVNYTSNIVIATARNFSYVQSGQRVATVKSVPFAVEKSQLEPLVTMLQERGPLLQGRPVRSPLVGVLYTDEGNGQRARYLFEKLLLQRLSWYGAKSATSLSSIESGDALTKSLLRLLLVKPSLILIASTTAPAGPTDAIGLALQGMGCQIEKFLAPVEPGNFMMLAYKDEVPIVSAPGCFRSCHPNVLDFLIPPLLSRYRVSGLEIACLGQGGLLS